MIRKLRAFLADRDAAVTIEYVVLLLPLLMMVLTIFQIALAYHFSLSAQKAVELGARIAAVRDPVHTGLPVENQAASGAFREGDSCALGSCAAPVGGPWVCTGADLGDAECDAVAFDAILQEVDQIAYLLDPEDVTITYSYGALGYVGGPFTPIVEVSIDERPFFLNFLFNFAFGAGDDQANSLQLAAVAASAIAEDLSTEN